MNGRFLRGTPHFFPRAFVIVIESHYGTAVIIVTWHVGETFGKNEIVAWEKKYGPERIGIGSTKTLDRYIVFFGAVLRRRTMEERHIGVIVSKYRVPGVESAWLVVESESVSNGDESLSFTKTIWVIFFTHPHTHWEDFQRAPPLLLLILLRSSSRAASNCVNVCVSLLQQQQQQSNRSYY